jgi:hypothetical protein
MNEDRYSAPKIAGQHTAHVSPSPLCAFRAAAQVDLPDACKRTFNFQSVSTAGLSRPRSVGHYATALGVMLDSLPSETRS